MTRYKKDMKLVAVTTVSYTWEQKVLGHRFMLMFSGWSAKACRKQWYLLSPGQHHLIFYRNTKSSVYNIFEDVCKAKFPGRVQHEWISVIFSFASLILLHQITCERWICPLEFISNDSGYFFQI